MNCDLAACPLVVEPLEGGTAARPPGLLIHVEVEVVAHLALSILYLMCKCVLKQKVEYLLENYPLII